MRNHSDSYNDSDEELYSRKSRRSRHSRSHLDRIQRRTALSLRPISQKCYADSGSDTELRRSKRRRKVHFENMSWLADDQMHKIGYPTLNSTGYYEESSRDAPDDVEPPRRITRLSNDAPQSAKRRESKNPKYLYDYDTGDGGASRRRDLKPVVKTRDLRSAVETNDKENTLEQVEVNGKAYDTRRRRSQMEINDSRVKKSDDSNEAPKQNGEDVKMNVQNKNKEVGEKLYDSDVITSTRLSTYRGSKPRSSSSESEHGKKSYSLRTRTPKPVAITPSVLRCRDLPRTRKRFTRRRKVSSSSSSSSSDQDVRHEKYSKNQHSKNEQKMKSGAGGSKIIPIGPETLDTNVRFSSIGGLDGHIRCLKEMILLPMMYPEVFRQFHVQPPRGVLFHGPPGTGKTLIARALANECSFGCRKVAFFMRKGADLLSKWIGESEKQLRLLFEQAAELQPSIIFFDELDGLAPVRSSRQDQVHASIVSTLLALMDGLDARGEVIVIGATNRIDAIDPALRRPGRFDRELFFPLPTKRERESILKVHVSQWKAPPSEQLVSYLAETAVGYCGSDLRALCSEAVIQAFRRTYPQVYGADYRLMLEPENVKVEKVDFLRAKSLLVPASHRITQGLGRKLSFILEPLLQTAMDDVFAMLEQTFPHALNTALAKVKLSPNMRPAQLLILGESSDCGQTTHLAPAILYQMEHIHSYILDLTILYKESGRSPEEALIQIFSEARRNVPSVIYIPNIDNWWSLVSETVKTILESQLSHLDSNIPILLLATAETTYDNLPDEIQNIFSRYRKEVFQLYLPNATLRNSFFRPLLLEISLKSPRQIRKRCETPLMLPRAPTPPPAPLTEEQSRKLYEQEEHTLRELRIFLRDICKKLANNKLFFMFTKPVDTEEVPDYTTIIKQPMDLETMMTKVDFHKFDSAKDFLKDIELIVQNALEYNPARTSADKQIRHRACSLRDYAYTLIKNEMDSDFEDKCQDISLKRRMRKASVQKYLPAYIQTPETLNLTEHALMEAPQPPPSLDGSLKNEEKVTPKTDSENNPNRKRKFSFWQRGMLKRQRKSSDNCSEQPDEEKRESSDDDDDDGDVEDDNNKEATVGNDHSYQKLEVEEDSTNVLSVNVDEEGDNTKKDPQSLPRRLSDLMSPSELLENPLEFDDIDEALNEGVMDTTVNIFNVECSKDELENVLEVAVKATDGSSLPALLDLYNHLSRIVKKFSNTNSRTELPKELLVEISRFKNEASPELSEDPFVHST